MEAEMKHLPNLIRSIVLLSVLATGLIAPVQTAAAPVSIPAGATITSATFSIFVDPVASNEPVRVHRITADWTEIGVTWNNFAGSFDPEITATFVPNSTGWRSVDVTALVQAWVNGVYPNYGILLEMGKTEDYATYTSSENSNISNRPELEICYTTSMIANECV